MSIVESFTTYLEANSTITAVLASANSIHPELLPQQHDGFPALVYSLTDDENINMLDGSVNELSFATIRLRILSPLHKAVHDVATVLKSELTSYRGVMGSNTVELVWKMSERGLPPEIDTELHSVLIDFKIAYH